MNINSKCITLASGGNKKGILEFLENDYVEVPDSLLYPKGILTIFLKEINIHLSAQISQLFVY